MLRLSKLADYGTVIIVHLAHRQPTQLSAKEIANEIHIPLPTVAKILKLFTHAGLLTSTRGAKGGYTLARDADDISVTDIIQAVDGATGLTECSIHVGECQIETVCQLRSNWQLINNVVNQALSNITLKQLAQPMLSEVSVPFNKSVLLSENAIYDE